MRTPIIAGNWKMHKTVAEAVEFVTAIKEDLAAIEGVDKVIAPPFVALAPLGGSAGRHSSIGLAAQNMYQEPSGAYTGEIAPTMLVDLCRYVILGHSERRAYFGETDAGVNHKGAGRLALQAHPHCLRRRESGTK